MAAAIKPCQDQLDRLYFELFGQEEERPQRDPSPSNLPDDVLIQKAMAAKNGEKFKALWEGDISSYDGDESAADMALMSMLAFWSGRDVVQMERLFSQSGLGKRDKWRSRSDYRAKTIQAAIINCKEAYGAKGIQVNNRFLNEITDDALNALLETNDPPRIFVRGGQLVRLADKGRFVIDPLSIAALRGIMARATGFVTVDEGGDGPEYTRVSPPKGVVEDILHLGTWPEIPAIESIVETPIIRPDGTVLSEPGYDEATRLYYAQPDELKDAKVPDAPTKEDAKAAAKYLIDEVFADFPFKDNASKANALGLLVSIVVRPAIDGCVPLALIDKPQAGTGASLLAEIAALVATGRPANMMGAPETEDEWRKSITSCLIDGSSITVIDNIVGKLRSAMLTRALTSRMWRDRFLGKSEMLDLPQRAVWIATGNNVSIGGDFARRSYWIRMDAAMARPWLRDDKKFRHPDILGWIKENHADLLSRLLIMARAWFVACKPACTTPTIGGFKEWSQTVGGILEFSGVPGFLANAKDLYDGMDTDVQQWDLFLEEWRAIHADNPITAGLLRSELTSNEEIYATFQEAIPEDVAEAISKGKDSLRLSHVLRKHLDQVYPSGRKLCQVRDEHRKQNLWQVVDIPAGVSPAEKPQSGGGSAGVAGVYSIREQFQKNGAKSQNIECMGETPATPASVPTDGGCDLGKHPQSQAEPKLVDPGLQKFKAGMRKHLCLNCGRKFNFDLSIHYKNGYICYDCKDKVRA